MQNKALKDISSRRLFAPYFKARWQNMQNIVNDSVFYGSIPEPWVSYYQAFIGQWLEWSTGFVPMLHRGDFFSLGMGYTVCDIFARECMSGGFRIDSTDHALRDFINDWHQDKLAELLNQMFFFSNAGGNALLVLTPVNGELALSVYPINRVFFECGRHDEITAGVILNRFVAGKDRIYYAKETRVFMDGAPYYKVDLSPSCGTAVSPSWQTGTLNEVPFGIRSQWDHAYGGISPGIWYRMPAALRTIGLFNVRNKSVAVALADLPGYSDSSLHTALDVLYALDFNYTQQQLDQYWGKTRVIIPKQMQTLNADVLGRNVMNVARGMEYRQAVESAPLEDEVYSEAPSDNSVDGSPIKPFFIQPDLRGEARKFIRDSDLEILASKVGLSSSTLANHLSYNAAKTATEVRSEQDTTEVSVNNKRALANRAINKMLKEVASFYGFTADVGINWNRAGVNTSSENAALLQDYEACVLPLREYLKRRWRDLDEEEIDTWEKELNENRERERRDMFGAPDGLDTMKDVTVDYV